MMNNLHKIAGRYSDLEKALIYSVEQYSPRFQFKELTKDGSGIVVQWFINEGNKKPINWRPDPEEYVYKLKAWTKAGKPEPQ